MKKKNATIIFIDDDHNFEEDPLLEEAKDLYKKVLFFVDPNKALDYIEKNLYERMIVMLDIGLSQSMPDGHEVLARIRLMSSLIQVIIWSGRDEEKEIFSDFIDNRVFAFAKKSATSEDLLSILSKAYICSSNNISGAIESWIKSHPEDAKDKPFMTSSDGLVHTLNDILREIRLQTPFGIEIGRAHV